MEDATSSVPEKGAEFFPERLRQESTAWVAEGVLSGGVREQILTKYGDSFLERVRLGRQSRFTQVMAVLGSVLMGLGALLFISTHWDELSDPVKVAVIMAGIAAAYGAGILMDRRGYPRTGMALMFLGAFWYGVGIALVAQIYHIQANSGMLFLIWGVGVALTGLALKSELFLSFSSILFLLWYLFTQLAEVVSVYLWYLLWMIGLGSSGFGFGRGASGPGEIGYHAEYLIPVAILIALAYWWKKPKLLSITVLGLLSWLSFAVTKWQADFLGWMSFFIILGAFFLIVSMAHKFFLPARSELSGAYTFFGFYSIISSSLLLTFSNTLNFTQPAKIDVFSWPYWAIAGVCGVVVLGAAVVGLIMQGVRAWGKMALVGLAVLAFFSFSFLFIPSPVERLSFSDALYRPSLGWSEPTLNPYMIIWTLITMAESVALMAFGYFASRRFAVYTGMISFVLVVLTRYFDSVYAYYVATYGTFLVSGILVIFVAYILERSRRAGITSAGTGSSGASAPPASSFHTTEISSDVANKIFPPRYHP